MGMRRMRWVAASGALAMGVVLAAGCQKDDADGAGSACELEAKLRGCHLLTAGTINCESLELWTCEQRCYSQVSCAQIMTEFCGSTSDVIQSCLAACEDEQPQFACADQTETIPQQWVCDGWTDCDAGGDEDGCPAGVYAPCDDGSDYFAEDRCDGIEDCSDGSDETGCPAGTRVDCADGIGDVPRAFVCDLAEDCEDASDERDCANLICPAG